MEDMYFNSSNLEYTKLLRNCDNFHKPYELPKDEFEKLHPNEYGFFQFGNLRLRILLGRILDFKCPWCNCEPEINYRKMELCPLNKEYEFIVECPNCKSRGPKKLINVKNEEMIEWVKELVKQMYMEKLSWDYNWK